MKWIKDSNELKIIFICILLQYFDQVTDILVTMNYIYDKDTVWATFAIILLIIPHFLTILATYFMSDKSLKITFLAALGKIM
jgi:hypothetical protein